MFERYKSLKFLFLQLFFCFFINENLSGIWGFQVFSHFRLFAIALLLLKPFFCLLFFVLRVELDFARKLTKWTTTMNKMAESYGSL